jgi:hypothetical protein
MSTCRVCDAGITASGDGSKYWLDNGGWFIAERPTLHAHRPVTDDDAVVTLWVDGVRASS